MFGMTAAWRVFCLGGTDDVAVPRSCVAWHVQMVVPWNTEDVSYLWVYRMNVEVYGPLREAHRLYLMDESAEEFLPGQWEKLSTEELALGLAAVFLPGWPKWR